MATVNSDAAAWLSSRARREPAAPALEWEGERLSFGELDRRVGECVAQLRAAGLGAGDRLALLRDNDATFAVAVHAAARVGATLLPLNTRLAPDELRFQLRDSRARFLWFGSGERARQARALSELPIGLLDEGLNRVTPAPERALDAGPEVLLLLYTSGTTGTPKGALLSAASLAASASASTAHLGEASGRRWLACLPLFHIGGLAILYRSVLQGGAVVLHSRFDPARVNRALDADDVSGLSLVPTMLARLLAERGDAPAPASLRCVLLGGAGASRDLVERGSKSGFPVCPTYGLTEAASQVATFPPGEAQRLPGEGLAVLPGNEIRVVDAAGSACPAGVAGEIWVRGPTLFSGYWGRPEETARALVDGWLRTGDVGQLGADGWLTVLDRRSDLIVSGGENVYPAEVEAVLVAHPDVADAAVVGVADDEFGQRPVAHVALEPGAPRDAGALLRFCGERLARYKLPDRVEWHRELPRNASGKLLRRRLRE
ncbi:MAG: o-succinylbenzoate--CoA ligase [Proteobacteria bacterium]|nr:o-succinylbenzoate--CoA ligase [Pseudomonadota bacterium]